jgi:hypothetical protein
MIALIVNSLAALFAVPAGVLWYRSSRVRTPETFSITVDITKATWNGSVGGAGHSTDLAKLAEALKLQSRLSRDAALCASVAALLQAIGLMLVAVGSN